MQVAMTGATGHVGANVVRALLEQGWKVRVLCREDVRALEGLDVERVRGDVRDPDSLRPLVAGAELVFNLAAHISLEGRARKGLDVNVIGPRNVAAACLEAGVRRLVHVSSIHAFDDEPGHGPIDEDRPHVADPSRPAYGLSKAAGEREIDAAIARGLDAVIVNPTGVIGPHDYKPSRMGNVLASLATGRLPFVPSGGYDWVDARDVAAGAIAAAHRGVTGRRYLLAGTWASLGELGMQIDQILGRPRRRIQVPLWTGFLGVPFAAMKARLTGGTPGCTMDSIRVLLGETHVSSARASAELGYAPRPQADTLRDILAWQASPASPFARDLQPLFPAALPAPEVTR